MATSFTLATLKAALQDHVEDDGTDYTGGLNTLIQLAEDKCLKGLPLTIFDARGNVSLVAGSQVPAKPSSCIMAHEISYVSAGATVFLHPRRYSFLRAAVPNTTQATPKWFADDYSETVFWIAPSPNLTITAEALMTKRPDSLVTTSPSWLSQHVGDLLFAACMASSERYGMALEDAAKWEEEFKKALIDARRDFARLLRTPYMEGR